MIQPKESIQQIVFPGEFVVRTFPGRELKGFNNRETRKKQRATRIVFEEDEDLIVETTRILVREG